MILYHGTSAKYLKSILKKGLLPREKTGNSNWDGDIISKPNLVYLTTAYPVYFALFTATRTNSDLLILKCEVREEDLFPDEDFLAYAQYHSGKHQGKSLEQLSKTAEPTLNAHLAHASLTYNGIASACMVPVERILSSRIIKHDDARIFSIGGDAMPIPANYRFLGANYSKSIEILFKNGIEEACTYMQKLW